jgi:hypothetical protein
MCVEIEKVFLHCHCRKRHIRICDNHVERTRDQRDQAPCPDYKKKTFEFLPKSCSTTMVKAFDGCKKISTTHWSFEPAIIGMTPDELWMDLKDREEAESSGS